MFTEAEIVAATKGKLLGKADVIFSGISTDTRAVVEGKLFIPLKGKRFDGHDFLGEAMRKGASGILLERGKESCLKQVKNLKSVILVQNTLQALGDIAHYWRKKWPGKVVAITGSAGKTTTKEMIAQILSCKMKVLKTEENFNNLVGIPLTLLKLTEEHEVAVLEMGTNSPGEIGKLCQISLPEVGLITNIGPAHLEGLGSIEGIREEKGEIFRLLSAEGAAVVNIDDEEVKRVAHKWLGRKITFGLSKEAEVRAVGLTNGPDEVAFTLEVGERKSEIRLKTPGIHNVRNALAAAAVSYLLGIEIFTISDALRHFDGLRGRFQRYRLANGVNLVDDTYNANPLSVREAILTFGNLKGKGRGIVILGDMLELGKEAPYFHENIGTLLGRTGADILLVKGNYAEDTARGAQKGGLREDRIFHFSQPLEVLAILDPLMKPGDWILVKGSRAMEMDKVVRICLEKYGLSPQEGKIKNHRASWL